MKIDCRHVDRFLNSLIKSVTRQDDMDEDGLEELVRTSLTVVRT